MTNFNPDGHFRDIEHWSAIAEQKASSTGMAVKIIGGVLAGGAGIAFGVELLGGVVGIWCVKTAWDASKNIGKRLRLVRDCGCNSFVLDEDDFRIYVKQFGRDAVLEELTFAQDAGVQLSPFAENWLNSTTKPLTPVQEAKQLQQAPQAIPQPVTVTTKPLFDTFQAEDQQSAPSITTIDTWNPQSNIDIVQEMTNQISNYFIVGIGGSGKGMLLANALRAIKQKHPNKRIFLINGKIDPKEQGYFDGIVDQHKALHCESAKPQTVATWFEAAIKDYDTFAQEHDGALLVIDEGTIIGARLKTAKCTTLTDKLIGITSCGGSSGKNVWFVAQTPFVGANGSDTSAISQLTPIVLVTSNNLSVVDSWKRASLFKKFNTEEIQELIDSSDCDRSLYFGKDAQWYSMPKLENYSSYDRDSHTYIKEVPSSEQPTVIQGNELSDKAQRIYDWLLSKVSNEWFYYRKSGNNERDSGLQKLLSRLELCGGDASPEYEFLELLESGLVEVSDDYLGIRLTES